VVTGMACGPVLYILQGWAQSDADEPHCPESRVLSGFSINNGDSDFEVARFLRWNCPHRPRSLSGPRTDRQPQVLLNSPPLGCAARLDHSRAGLRFRVFVAQIRFLPMTSGVFFTPMVPGDLLMPAPMVGANLVLPGSQTGRGHSIAEC